MFVKLIKEINKGKIGGTGYLLCPEINLFRFKWFAVTPLRGSVSPGTLVLLEIAHSGAVA